MPKVKINHPFLILLLLFSIRLNAQDARLADSLKIQLRQSDAINLDLLHQISIEENNPDSILKYASLLIESSKPDSNFKMLFNGYLQEGNGFRLKGDFDLAFESYFHGIDYAYKIDFKEGKARLFIAIADTYSENKNSTNAKSYYDKGISMLRSLKDSVALARALINAGDEYYKIGQLDSSLLFTRESENIFKKMESPLGQAFSLGNMGMVFAKLGQDDLAEKNINKAVAILDDLSYYYPISEYYTVMSDIYLEKNEERTALEYAMQSLDLAQKHGLKDQISSANLKISEIYEFMGDHHNAFLHYRDHVMYRDSVQNLETLQEMFNQRTSFEVSQKQAEVDLLNEQKRNQHNIRAAMSVILGLFAILLLTLYWYYRSISKQKKTTDNLLLNILPAETAEELKKNGKVMAKRFESVSVLFTDFQAFTMHSENLSPEVLVESVDYYFSKFDEIIEKYGLEKIKTIGDAYMCAGGLPFPNDDHPSRILKAALEISDFVTQAKKEASEKRIGFDVRIGVNTGPAVAGVVGTKKFAYDIWGDTVNIAARMESNSMPGKINISEKTYQLVKDEFDCVFRGEVEVKNKGRMKMYYLEGVKLSGGEV